MADHYEILGVDRDATEEEIKDAARRKAKEHHPDKPDGDTEMMQLVVQAKLVLLNPKRRARYDRTGDDTGTTMLDQAAGQMLADFFSQYIENGGDENPLDVIRHTLAKGTADVRASIRSHEERIQKLSKRMGRLKRKKSNGHNLFASILTARINQTKAAIASAEKQIAINNCCVILLEDYEFDPPPPPPPQPGQPKIFTTLIGVQQFFEGPKTK